MMEIITRKASSEDLTVLYSFEQDLIRAERPFDPTLREGLIHYYDLKAMISDPAVYLIVAENKQKIIGSGYARIETAKPFMAYTRYAYLGFMYVDPAYRKLGVNTKIMATLRHWAIEQGMTEMRLDVYDNNLVAVNAYMRAGFTRHVLEMRMSLL